MRTPRQRANDAAIFRCRLRNELDREADRLEALAAGIRKVSDDLSVDVELPEFDGKPWRPAT
jgi:hypothetical protein